MKILLSWLLDYLDSAPTDLNIDKIIHLFNTRTAEIESYQPVTFDHAVFFIVKIVKSGNEIEVFCPELNQTITLPKRNDGITEKYYLVLREDKAWRWASLGDFEVDTQGLMPALHVTEQEIAGSWKKSIPTTDYVLEIDNKSINHRPDLWGHYGIAREVAAFLNVPLKPISSVLQKLEILDFKESNKNENFSSLTISLQAPTHCTRFAAMICDNVANLDSVPWMAIRLARLGAKPINAIVDLTNYVMFDVGHPMHAFDATTFPENEMIIRMAAKNEKLELLDGQKVELENTDITIANIQEVVSLAGIMGGKLSGISPTTKHLIIEAAGFNPLTIRKTTQRLKLRSEASMRFEKHLDPMQNVTAIQRFVFLAQKLNILTSISTPIISVGEIITSATCTLSHEFVEIKIGSKIDPNFIQKSLTKLDFAVVYDAKTNSYVVTIPTSRMTKDIKIQEDLVEEIIRSYGFENLKTELPARKTTPFSTIVVNNIDHIKHHLAYGLHMHELNDYLLYDAAFIKRLDIDLTDAIHVRNPISENWTTLVTSLIPHLLKAVENNAISHNHVRFFEYNGIWHKNKGRFIEEKSLSGIIFDKKNIDFYQAKAELASLFEMLQLKVVWKKPTTPCAIWYNPHQVAHIYSEKNLIGIAGMMSSTWMHKIVQGSAFIFELNGNILAQHSNASMRFTPWSKFQDVCYDISLLIPLQCSIETLKNAILQTDKNIRSVELVDFFEKKEWPNLRAVTLRYIMNNHEKTMNKQEIDAIVAKVSQTMAAHDAQIR